MVSLAPFISENLLFIMQENYLSQQRFADLPLHPIVQKSPTRQGDLNIAPLFKRYRYLLPYKEKMLLAKRKPAQVKQWHF